MAANQQASGNMYNHAETIQKLERLNQLETVTAEQRIRIEKYRTMYETLKAEHENNDEERHRRDNEIRILQSEIKSIEHRAQEIVTQTRNERDVKIEECEELKMKILTPQKLEVMKMKLQEEVEAPFKQRIESLELEVDKYRNEFNRLRYDYSFLKSEYEHELSQKKNILDDAERQFQLEKETLEKQVVALTDELHNQDPADLMKMRMLQKENTQLNLRVKSLLNELEELRDKKENSNLQNDQASRYQAKQLSDLSLQCKTLEAERETTKLQIERLQKELEKCAREQDTCSTDLHRAERDNFQLKSQLEESEHNHKMETNNIKLSLMKDRSELEQDRESLRMELNVYKNKAAVNEASMNELKRALDLKEEEAMKRVQSIKEEEWGRINKLENNKAQLESELATAEQRKLEVETAFKSQLEQIEERAREDRTRKEKCERDIANTKSLLMQEKQKSKNLEQDIEKLLEIKQKHQKLMQIYDSMASSEQQLKNDVDKLSHTTEILRKELDISQEDLQKQREIHTNTIHESRMKFEEEKKLLQQKHTDIHKEHKDLKKKHEKLSQTAKKKTKKLKFEVATLTDQLQLMKTKEDQYELEKHALMKNMNFEQERMKRKFHKIRQRQTQFCQVLNASNANGFPEYSPMKRTSSFLLQDDFLASLPPRSNVSPTADMMNSQDENRDPMFS